MAAVSMQWIALAAWIWAAWVTPPAAQAFSPRSTNISHRGPSIASSPPTLTLPVASRNLFDFPVQGIDSHSKSVQGVLWEDFALQWKAAFEGTEPEDTQSNTSTRESRKQRLQQQAYLHYHPTQGKRIHQYLPPWKDVWQTSSKLASSTWDVTTKVTGATWWLATDASSPTAPLRRFAGRFLRDRASETVETLKRPETRKKVWDTTRFIGQRLIETSQKVGQKYPVRLETGNVGNKVNDFLSHLQSRVGMAEVDEEILEIQRLAQTLEAEINGQRGQSTHSPRSTPVRDPEPFHRALLATQLNIRAKELQKVRRQKAELVHRNLLCTRLALHAKSKKTPAVDISALELDDAIRYIQKMEGPEREKMLTQIQLAARSKAKFPPAPASLSKMDTSTDAVEGTHQNQLAQPSPVETPSLSVVDRAVERTIEEQRYLPRISSVRKSDRRTDDEEIDRTTSEQPDSHVLMHASMGLTAPLDKLKDTELKSREEETAKSAGTEKQKKQIRAKEEQIQLHELMMELQHNAMAKKQRARQIREEGSFQFIVAAMSQEEMVSRPISFDRSSMNEVGPSEDSEQAASTELSFEELNRKIREKWQVERIRNKVGQPDEGSFVLNRFHRRRPSVLERVVSRAWKRSFRSVRHMATRLVQLCVTRFLGPTLESNGFLVASNAAPPRRAPTHIPERTSWQENLHSV